MKKRKKMKAIVSRFLPVPLLLLCTLAAVNAQTFNGAVLPEYPYPVPGTVIPGPTPNPVNRTTHTFTYTIGHVAYMNPYVAPPAPPYVPAMPPFGPGQLSDLTLHSWDDPGSTAGLAWINRENGTGIPGTIYDQGFMMYPSGVQDIEMSLQQDQMGYNFFPHGSNAAWYVIVSFYNSNPANYTGVGHYVEFYIWNNPIPIGTGGLTFVARTQLSNIANYTRIRQDGHNTYGFAITWEDPVPGSPTWGINHVQGFMNPAFPGVSMSGVINLAGTGGQTFPDVAFMHAAGGLNLQFIYQALAPGLTITSSTVPFTLGPPWPAIVAPAVIDVNPTALAVNVDVRSRIDAPDHYGYDNWAYVYTLPPYNQVSVRFQNCNPGPCAAATYIVNDGSLGNVRCDVDPMGFNHTNDWPFISFDATASSANVGWYTQYQFPAGTGFFLPNIGGYIDVQLTETGVLTNVLDYLQLGLSTTASNQNASVSPSVAYSRQNDRTDYHYLVFANNLCPSPAAQIQTKERLWGNASFKGGSDDHDWHSEFYAGGAKASSVNAVAAAEMMMAYPNPFRDEISLLVPEELQEDNLQVLVQDITGRVIDRYTGAGNSVNVFLAKVGKTLSSGSYMIIVNSEKGDLKKTFKVQKLAAAK